jgi:hypothetical protein
MKRIAAVSVVLVSLAAAPAARAESDRAAAKDFGRAAERLYVAVQGQRAVVEAGNNRLSRDPVCADALMHVPKGDAADEIAADFVFPYEFEALLTPIVPALHDYVAALDRVKVGDARLRSGRSALRLSVRGVRNLEPAPADVCAQLQAWQQAGYPVKGAPKIDDPAFDALFTLPQSLNKKIERAARRLRSLGVSRRTSQRFTGDTEALYKGWDLDDDVPIGDASG